MKGFETYAKRFIARSAYLCAQITKTKLMSINHYFISAAVCLTSLQAHAQLSKNPDKFLGNITTGYSVDYGKEKFYTLWNQITPENESKWDAIEPSRGNFTFGGADNSANYAKKYGFPFKYHTLIWGGQYPGWMNNLSTAEQYKAIVEYFDAVKKHYPNLEIIDVVNEAIDGHAPAPYKAALGGNGRTGYDWIIKAFQLAHERWPNAILVYNDYNTFQHQKTQFKDLVRTLRDAGAPVDAYGCQSHDITDMNLSTFQSAMTEIQNDLRMPMYSTEFDIGTTDDKKQETQYKNLLKYLWEADYCAGVTLWGYIYGHTWINLKDANNNVIERGISGLIKDGKDRPAMTWLREYMASDKAKNTKSPFPGFKKEASVYVKPASLKIAKGDKMPIWVSASLATKTIEKVDLYTGTSATNATTLVASMTEAPYIAEYTAPTNSTGWKILKAVVTATDGSTYERLARVSVQNTTTKREPYNETIPELPGIINIAEYDKGNSGVSYSNASRTPEKTAAKDDGWMEYTVNVKEDGLYVLEMEVASESQSQGLLHLVDNEFGNFKFLTDFISVPNTGSKENFMPLRSVLRMELTAGEHRFGLIVDKGGFYMKNMTLSRYEEDNTMTCTVSKTKSTITVGESTVITVNASSKTSTVSNVKIYANGLLIATLTEAPYTFEYEPTIYGQQTITAVVTDVDGKSKTSTASTLTVNPKREPYKDLMVIPGTIEAEDYDKGGEGFSYHDSDTKNEGNANYRTDNGVDIVTGNGGKAIGYTAVDEWLEYSVNVAESGKYTCEAVVSAGVEGAKITVQRIKGTSKTTLGTIDVPKTGSDWSKYTTVALPVSTTNKSPKAISLTAGEQIIRITFKVTNCNIDKLIFKSIPTDIEDIESDKQTGITYNLSGQKVDNGYRGIVIRNGKKVIKK